MRIISLLNPRSLREIAYLFMTIHQKKIVDGKRFGKRTHFGTAPLFLALWHAHQSHTDSTFQVDQPDCMKNTRQHKLTQSKFDALSFSAG